MESITHKPILKKICECLENNSLTVEEQVAYIDKHVLKKKVKFPLLEYFTSELFQIIHAKNRIKFLDRMVAVDEIGSYTIAGKFLQLLVFTSEKSNLKRLPLTFKKAGAYIITADKWYACDIIGERVFGYALLKEPVKTLPHLKTLAKHEDKWMQRTIGVAGHYAIKKGLDKKNAETLFKLLLSLSEVTDFHTKKGIGWAGKTTAKFHPDLIKKYDKEIYQNEKVKQWFKTKIKIGLGRSYKYASKYNSKEYIK